ncbi:pentapeptide repeat-containing protein [Streptomyces sp. NPDC057411]|uniref:pentapeptide repeat-containing protein n=1 Tax=unclassified Streptomyces TaxID=2593676 RepID=UPI00363E8B9C
MFLTWVDLRRSDLRGADLQRAILNAADLRASWLAEAKLNRSSLCDANLCGSRLDDANLTGADLRGADLRDSVGLTAKQLSRAVLNEATRLPSELANDPWVVARLAACQAWRAQHGVREPPPPTPAPTLRAVEGRVT